MTEGGLILGRIASEVVEEGLGGARVVADNFSVDNNGLAGREFGILWLPGLGMGASTVAGGQAYGVATHPNWVIPATGNNSIAFVEGGSAGMVVVPEPAQVG